MEDLDQSPKHFQVNDSFASFFPYQFRFSLLRNCPTSCSTHRHSMSCHWFSSCSILNVGLSFVLMVEKLVKGGNWLRPETSASHSPKTSSHRFSFHLADSPEAITRLATTATGETHILIRIETEELTVIAHGAGEASGWPDAPKTSPFSDPFSLESMEKHGQESRFHVRKSAHKVPTSHASFQFLLRTHSHLPNCIFLILFLH